MALPNKVNIGTAPGNGTGDQARTAFDKLNKRDEYLETNKADKSELTGFETPAGAQAKADAAEASAKDYTDTFIQGLKWKDAVDVATTANITLSGEQTIDGVTTSVSRVLVKDQTNQAENGIYISDAGAWTRATDADAESELIAATVKVQSGTANTGFIYSNSNSAITIGTTAITFVKIGDAVNHNSTNGLQGGQAGEYFHLTQALLDKLNAIEAGATADQSGAEIKQLYEVQPNTNAFTDIRRDKVDGLPANVEPAFAKNDAFNKTFGIVANTVAQGNDSRIINGQTAFEWGDHAEAGYALSSEVNALAGRVTTAESDIDALETGKADVFTTDESLYLDPVTNEVRANISTYPQTLTKAGSQVFTLDFEPTNFLVIHGKTTLFPEDYIFTPPTTFEVIPLMDEGEKVRLVYERFIEQPV